MGASILCSGYSNTFDTHHHAVYTKIKLRLKLKMKISIVLIMFKLEKIDVTETTMLTTKIKIEVLFSINISPILTMQVLYEEKHNVL